MVRGGVLRTATGIFQGSCGARVGRVGDSRIGPMSVAKDSKLEHLEWGNPVSGIYARNASAREEKDRD